MSGRVRCAREAGGARLCTDHALRAEHRLRIKDLIPEAYAAYAQPIFAAFATPKPVTKETDVAEAVWLAANDASGQLRFPAGPDAVALAQAG